MLTSKVIILPQRSLPTRGDSFPARPVFFSSGIEIDLTSVFYFTLFSWFSNFSNFYNRSTSHYVQETRFLPEPWIRGCHNPYLLLFSGLIYKLLNFQTVESPVIAYESADKKISSPDWYHVLLSTWRTHIDRTTCRALPGCLQSEIAILRQDKTKLPTFVSKSYMYGRPLSRFAASRNQTFPHDLPIVVQIRSIISRQDLNPEPAESQSSVIRQTNPTKRIRMP